MSSGDGGGLGRDAVERVVRGILTSIFGGWANINRLEDFATTPLKFLRARAIPVVIGGIFGRAFDMAQLIARPFDAVLASLGLVNESISTATAAITEPIGDALALSGTFLVSLTAPFGPLQPFALAALAIAIGYGVIVVSVRLGRAAADSIPVVSGVETFLFG